MIVNDTLLTKVNAVDRLYPIHFAECENVTLCVLGDCKHIKADQYHAEEDAIVRDENSQPFSIRKICPLTPKW